MKLSLRKEGNAVQTSPTLREVVDSLRPGDYEIEIKRVYRNRTLAQNRYWWGVVVPLVAEEIGNVFDGMNRQDADIGKQETHEALVNRFLPKRTIKNPLDRRRKIVKQTRTSDLDTLRFKQLVDEVLRVFPFIPAPDTGNALQVYDEMLRRYG